MVAYSFQRQFADPILMGRKRHTVRAQRKRHARPGEALQLYTGMRTKACRLIARATCEAVEPISICFGLKPSHDVLTVNGRSMRGQSDRDAFAYSDGFANWLELREFWAKHHGDDDFSGVIIRWRDMVPA